MQNEWTLGKITVGLRWSRDADGREHIERRVSFSRSLTAAQKETLLQIAGNSPISSLLRPGIAIQSALMD